MELDKEIASLTSATGSAMATGNEVCTRLHHKRESSRELTKENAALYFIDGELINDNDDMEEENDYDGDDGYGGEGYGYYDDDEGGDYVIPSASQLKKDDEDKNKDHYYFSSPIKFNPSKGSKKHQAKAIPGSSIELMEKFGLSHSQSKQDTFN